MATHSRFGLFVLLSSLLLTACATRVPIACVGDPETLGYHDGTLGQRVCADAARGMPTSLIESGWTEGIQRFCTEEQGYQQGCRCADIERVPGHAGRELPRWVSIRLRHVPDATRGRRHGAIDRSQVRRARTDLVATRRGSERSRANRHRRPFARAAGPSIACVDGAADETQCRDRRTRIGNRRAQGAD